MIYTIDEIVRRITPVAKKHGIQRIFLFGSYARGEARDDSDIDLLVDDTGVSAHSLFQWGGIYADFADVLGKDTDMVLLQSLHQPAKRTSSQSFRHEVLKEKKLIYGIE